MNCACGVRVRRLDACTLFQRKKSMKLRSLYLELGSIRGLNENPGSGAVLESTRLAIGFDLWETSVVATKRILKVVKGLVRCQPLVLASFPLEVSRFRWIFLKNIGRPKKAYAGSYLHRLSHRRSRWQS